MTTKVTVETHDWPVVVKIIDEHETEKTRYFAKTEQIVDPHSSHEVHITSTRRVTVIELPLPEKQPD
jgi:hypothetical protein